MKVAHIILVFKEPVQVERLIRKMSHPAFDFYLHIDKKSSIDDYLYLAKIPNVYFINDRIKVRWAAFSGLNAAIRSLQFIIDRKIEYDFINVLSGQDYPIE